jgi:hypothetical protein
VTGEGLHQLSWGRVSILCLFSFSASSLVLIFMVYLFKEDTDSCCGVFLRAVASWLVFALCAQLSLNPSFPLLPAFHTLFY